MKDIATTIRTARQNPSSENLEAMWQAVMRLPAWYFLPAALGEETTPLVGELDDGRWLLAFTHFRALNDFARVRDMRSTAGEVPMLALSPTAAVAHLGDVAAHIEGVAFNLGGDLVFRAPTQALLQFAERFLAPTG